MGRKKSFTSSPEPVSCQVDVEHQLHVRLQQLPPVESVRELVETLYPQQLHAVQDLIQRALQFGESNSALIVGSRGVGKTTLLRVALSQYCSFPDVDGASLSLSAGGSDGVLVRLHGLMHTDDRLALREITRQLKLEHATATKQFGSFAGKEHAVL
ncbi:P-loop containing nucleoside triphosphate hydrolase [Trinorchestia longiramus]|nr:P-loop containing nucleoside triphosphate hydrolase [Trinorchestia longiramus]